MGEVSILPAFGPRIFIVDSALSLEEIGVLREQCSVALQKARRDQAGASVELSELPAGLVEKVEKLAGIKAASVVLRVRHYSPGQGHPLHSDHYEASGLRLVFTGIYYLSTCQGGATAFPKAQPVPLQVEPKAGRLVGWWSEDTEGRLDRCAAHEGLPVITGEKLILAVFLYVPRHTKQLFVLGEAQNPLVEQFLKAARSLGAKASSILPEAAEGPLPPGSVLLSTLTGERALRAEQLLTGPGVISSYLDPEAAHFPYRNGVLLLQRHKVPVPPTCFLPPNQMAELEKMAEKLGGFPLVVKFLGGSGGVGVIPVETLAGLVAVLELGEGRVPLVAKRIVGAVHYRVFVVGQRAVGCYKNLPAPDGFRTVPSLDPVDHSGDVPEPIARAAVDACRALRLRFGGADILVRGEEVYVLEVNNPAWFGHMIGIDIARLLLEELFQLKIS